MVQCDPGSPKQWIDTDCDAHLMIEDAVVSTQYGLAIKATFSVLGCTVPEHVGKSFSEFFSCEGKAVDKAYNLAEAAGLITAEQRKAAAQQDVGMEIDETLLKGKQLCGQIRMESKMRENPVTKKKEVDPENPTPYPRLGFRTFSVHSTKAEDIPKDQQFLAMVTGQGQQGQAAPAQTAAPPQQPQQQASATSPSATSSTGMNW